MKHFFRTFATLLAAIAGALICAFVSCSAHAQAIIEEVNTDRMMQVISANSAVIIEFYDSKSNDASGECAAQLPIYQSVASQYQGKVTFLRFDIEQDMPLAEAGRLQVCPTHLFVFGQLPDPHTVPNRTPFRRMGLLTEDQFKELIGLFFGR